MKQAKKIWNGVNVKIRDFLASLCFSGPSFLGMLMFFVAPFCVVIYYSFIAGALDHSFVGLKNYINVWNNGAFQIAVKNTAEATALITKHPEIFTDYEITKGKMDDVFLAVTGKKLTGGAEK